MGWGSSKDKKGKQAHGMTRLSCAGKCGKEGDVPVKWHIVRWWCSGCWAELKERLRRGMATS